MVMSVTLPTCTPPSRRHAPVVIKSTESISAPLPSNNPAVRVDTPDGHAVAVQKRPSPAASSDAAVNGAVVV